ncbi:MAG: hypothetical protein F4X34_07940, partial [Chloroflexi bacterium]|nr:hypothetical protein [Chloroflexota bacterium]
PTRRKIGRRAGGGTGAAGHGGDSGAGGGCGGPSQIEPGRCAGGAGGGWEHSAGGFSDGRVRCDTPGACRSCECHRRRNRTGWRSGGAGVCAGQRDQRGSYRRLHCCCDRAGGSGRCRPRLD